MSRHGLMRFPLSYFPRILPFPLTLVVVRLFYVVVRRGSPPARRYFVALLMSLDRIKCRLLEGSNAQEVRAMVLDMQARLLLDMLGKGIESALINPSALVPDPWQVSSETLSNIDPETVAVDPALIPCIQALTCFIHW